MYNVQYSLKLLNFVFVNPYQRKNIIYSILLGLSFLAVWGYRRWNAPEAAEELKEFKKIELWGNTQGTTFSVKYLDKQGRNLQKEVDSLLVAFSQSLSTYIPESEISRFNREALHKFESPFFYPVLQKSKEVFKETGGAFDPTIAPLVNAWGFGPEGRKTPTEARLASLLPLVNFDSIFFDSVAVCKMIPHMQLDFNSIAQGYSVDVVADYLKSKGISHMFVEIGGEAYAQGYNEKGERWRIGINTPSEDLEEQQKLQAVVSLKGQAIATSGNYRNFYEKDGVKYAHTISPVTGRPVQHSLLSVSVFAPDCMTADAYATAFMVIGMEKAKAILDKNKALDAYFIYSDARGKLQTWTSPGMEEQINIISSQQ